MQFNGVEFSVSKNRHLYYITFYGSYEYFQNEKLGCTPVVYPRVVVSVKKKEKTTNYKLNHIATLGFANIGLIYKNEKKLVDLLKSQEDMAFLERFAIYLKELK